MKERTIMARRMKIDAAECYDAEKTVNQLLGWDAIKVSSRNGYTAIDKVSKNKPDCISGSPLYAGTPTEVYRYLLAMINGMYLMREKSNICKNQ